MKRSEKGSLAPGAGAGALGARGGDPLEVGGGGDRAGAGPRAGAG